MRTINRKKNRHGFSLIEVLIACAIISTSIFVLMSATQKGIDLSSKALRQAQAGFLMEEGAEAVKVIRDTAWTNISGLTLDTNYYLTFNTGTNTWSLGTTIPSPIDSLFTRTVVFSAVNRDVNDDIAATGTLDARTKQVTVTVSWSASDGTLSRTVSFYISDIFT